MFGRFQRSRPTACDERSSAKAAEDRAQPKNALSVLSTQSPAL